MIADVREPRSLLARVAMSSTTPSSSQKYNVLLHSSANFLRAQSVGRRKQFCILTTYLPSSVRAHHVEPAATRRCQNACGTPKKGSRKGWHTLWKAVRTAERIVSRIRYGKGNMAHCHKVTQSSFPLIHSTYRHRHGVQRRRTYRNIPKGWFRFPSICTCQRYLRHFS